MSSPKIPRRHSGDYRLVQLSERSEGEVGECLEDEGILGFSGGFCYIQSHLELTNTRRKRFMCM